MIPDAPDRAAPVRAAHVVVVLRRDGAVLVAKGADGLGLPHGPAAAGERAGEAALRVLHERCGVLARAPRPRGRVPGLGWAVVEVGCGPLPDAWQHHASGAAGEGTASMAWHPLDAPARGFPAPMRRVLAVVERLR